MMLDIIQPIHHFYEASNLSRPALVFLSNFQYEIWGVDSVQPLNLMHRVMHINAYFFTPREVKMLNERNGFNSASDKV